MKRNVAGLFSAVAPFAEVALLLGFSVWGLLAPAAFGGNKTLSGKLRAVDDKVLTVEENKLLETTLVEVEIDSGTKVTGELTPGMMIKLKCREEKAPGIAVASEDKAAEKNDGKEKIRLIAIQVKTWPEHSSRRDRKAAPDTQP